MKKILFTLILTFLCLNLSAKETSFSSPDNKTRVELSINNAISFSLFVDGKEVLTDCQIGMDFSDELKEATSYQLQSIKTTLKTESIQAPFYRTSSFSVTYRQYLIKLNKNFQLEFRLFNDGIAYRFITNKTNNKLYKVINETVRLHLTEDFTTYLPYSTNPKNPTAMAFQATYDAKPQSQQAPNNLAFLPIAIDCGNKGDTSLKLKLTLMESDLESYPGMFIRPSVNALDAFFSPYPKDFDYYPWRRQKYVTSQEDYIAQCQGDRSFPWRIVSISRKDTEMPVNNLVYALATPNRIGDTTWIHPGKVAWDWWNNWGLTGVDFKAGINMETYRYYIDFASKYGLEYIILDEGWYKPSSGDMLTTIDDIQLPELVAYAKEKNVKIILWTVFNVLDSQLAAACQKYADMGIAGFKVDFLDRDDQEAVEMAYRIADTCAKYHLVLDYHGIYKPTGINRTYPNILNFESVFGMEETKWTAHDAKDMPLYDVTFPFIRLQCGFVDFTPGGMRNATKQDFQPIYNNPLTMGTRCHQMAMYVVHDSPLTMLADNPTAYEQDPAFTSFLASIPVIYDETLILQGKMGEYIITARRKGNDWYVGGQTNWNAKDVTLPLDFLADATTYKATLYADGPNADQNASDYQTKEMKVTKTTSLNIHLASGGGFLIRLKK